MLNVYGTLIERVQHRAMKSIADLNSISYSERLKILDLDSLQARCCMLNMVEVYKILHSLSPLSHTQMFKLAKSERTRGHN